MLVKDLIKELKKYKESEIIFSQDEEGNGFMSKCFLGYENNQVVIYPYDYIMDI